MTTEKLWQDLIAAKTAALKAVEKMADGGTCNFDTCVLEAPKGVDVKLALQIAGLDAHYRPRRRTSMWSGWFIQPPVGGQADVRLTQAETMAKELKAAGWNVTVYYQMD